MYNDINPLFEIILWAYNTGKSITAETVKDYFVHAPQYYYAWILSLLKDSPQHVLIETGLVCFIIWLVFIRKTVDPSQTSRNNKLTKAEVDELIETWEPEPFVPVTDKAAQDVSANVHVIESVSGNNVTVRGFDKPILNLVSFDFLGPSQSDSIKDVAEAALNKYGCGSCGPRGFYGTIDTHLKIEAAIAKFMGVEEAIAYSDGASAVTSAIPAFSKKGDLLVIDEACSEPVLTGANLSRSTVKYFKHNDMADLEKLLVSISKDDKKLRRDPTQQRRFIVVEGLYRNTGNLCPLPELMALKEKFCYRLILDETLSFGTVGSTGRGLTEHFKIPVTNVEILTLTMDTALASVGGFCLGTREVVDHQRLSGAGYCFSASAPPFLTAAAVQALAEMESNPQLIANLHENAAKLHKGLSAIKGWKIVSKDVTAVMHLCLDVPDVSPADEIDIINSVSIDCMKRGVGVVPSKFALLSSQAKRIGLRPSLRITATAALTNAEIKKAVTEIGKAAEKAIKSLK